ncbi:MAG: DUF2946 domain-containing protein [Azoarcus sp.]|nr:DUF2946 domain-containing protein [Azoarcus sp.]
MGTTINNRYLKKPLLWLAIFAILMASFAPAISRIWFGQTTLLPGWAELCTIEGLQKLPVALFGNTPSAPRIPGDADRQDNCFAQCPFCLTHAGSFGLSPVELAPLPFIAAHGRYFPPLFFSALHARFIWQPSQARAPPLFL